MADVDCTNKIEEILEIFRSKAVDAANKIASFVDDDDKRLAFDASKYITKVSGAEVDQVKHSGTVQFEPVQLSRTTD